MNRAERRRLKQTPQWERRTSPKEAGYGSGWCGELDRAYTNGKYAVMARSIQTEWGQVEHACIRNTGNTDIPWADKQAIKNDLFGPERVAIEVFPAVSELVDAANMYHIWVLPKDFKLPFTLKENENDNSN